MKVLGALVSDEAYEAVSNIMAGDASLSEYSSSAGVCRSCGAGCRGEEIRRGEDDFGVWVLRSRILLRSSRRGRPTDRTRPTPAGPSESPSGARACARAPLAIIGRSAQGIGVSTT